MPDPIRQERSTLEPFALAPNSAAEVRQSYAMRWPWYLQHSVTRFSGHAARGERQPRLALGPLWSWAATLAQLVLGVGAGIFALSWLGSSGIVVLPLTWIMTVNALRKLQATYAHYAVHGRVAESKQLNRVVHAVSSTVALVHNFDDYYKDHVVLHHDRKVFTTAADPDAAFLLRLGFVPGLDVAAGWRLLRHTLLSVRFHRLFVAARVRTNLLTASWPRRVLTLVWLGVLGWVAVFIPLWIFILVVVVPYGPGYHISALLQFLSEHAWLTDGPALSREDYARRCWGRFCLEPLPDPGLDSGRRLGAWVRWTIRTMLVQAPWRYGVLAGDLCVHDYHHLYPQDRAWWFGLWGRQNAVDGRDPRGLAERELLGPAAITAVFSGLSRSTLATGEGVTTDSPRDV